MKTYTIAFYFLAFLQISCSHRHGSAIEQYTITITDELRPAAVLPECMELNSEGQLIFRTSRFNDDGTIYQKNFFIELDKKQSDSVMVLIDLLWNQNLAPIMKKETDTLVYKVNINWLIQGQRSNHLLIGNRFAPPLNQLIAYCQKLPEKNHHFALKEAHYFSTDEICSRSGK